MKFLSLALLIIFVFNVKGFAQKSPLSYGDIPMEDLTMTSYDADTSAAAVFLLRFGETHIEMRVGKYRMVTNVHVRMKILNSKGVSRADVSILLFDYNSDNAQKIAALKGATYNLDGGKLIVSELDNENVFKGMVTKNFNSLQFTMPNVKVGSVFEYSYSFTSDFILNFPTWYFQERVPVRKMEYWATVPKNWFLEKNIQGYLAPQYAMKEAMMYGMPVVTNHWTMDEVPAFKPEPVMTSEEDYISKIYFAFSGIQTDRGYIDNLGSWQVMTNRFMKAADFGQVLTKSGFLRAQANELADGITDPLKKAEAIHDYVKKTIKWNGQNRYSSFDAKKAFDERKGSSGDINLLLGALLMKAGFDVTMILISTRDHGFIRKQFPIESQFNYVVCTIIIDNKVVWLDATNPYIPINVLPERCLNGEGLIVSSRSYGWQKIPYNTKARTVIAADFILNTKGELKGNVKFLRDGYAAYDMRSSYASKGETDYLKSALNDKSWKIDKSEFFDVNDVTKPVRESHAVVIEEHASIAGDIIYMNPLVDSRRNENPFKTETRLYPVDFRRPEESLYTAIFTLPEGFVVDEIPESKAFKLLDNAARFSYNAAVLGNKINITSSLIINRVLFLPDEYAALREFFAQVVTKQNEQIVIKKN